MARRVVVTGLGLVSALGIGTEETWKNILAGRSGVGPITQFDSAGFAATIAAEVKNFDPLQHIEKREVKKMGRFIQFAMAAAQITAPDGNISYYACITIGMHPGQGQAGPGYDAVTYNFPVIIQVQPGNGLGSQATPNMEGIACRLMYQGDQVFDVITGKPFPPLP